MNIWETAAARVHQDRFSAVSETAPTPPRWVLAQQLVLASSQFEPTAFAAPLETQPGQPEDDSVDEREYAERHREEANETIREAGFEAIAFYASLHYYGKSKWGIYFNEPMFYGSCASLARELPHADWDRLVWTFFAWWNDMSRSTLRWNFSRLWPKTFSTWEQSDVVQVPAISSRPLRPRLNKAGLIVRMMPIGKTSTIRRTHPKPARRSSWQPRWSSKFR